MSFCLKNKSIRFCLAVPALAFAGLGIGNSAYAAGGNNASRVGLVSGKMLDEEFGPGSGDLTHRITRRHNVKLLLRINQYCAGALNRTVAAPEPVHCTLSTT